MKRIKKGLLMLTFALCLLGLSSQAVTCSAASSKKNGLVKEKGKYYYYQKGKKVTNKWKTITTKGKKYTYYFGKNGAAYAGTVKDGIAIPAVKKVGRATYGFDKKGRRLKGIQVIKEKFYVFSSNGKLNEGKSKKLRQATLYNKDAAKLIKLLKKYGGKLKKTEYFSGGCYRPDQGKDGSMTWDTFELSIFRYNSGKIELLAINPRS